MFQLLLARHSAHISTLQTSTTTYFQQPKPVHQQIFNPIMVFESPYGKCEPDPKFKDSLSLFFWHQLDKFAANTLLVDFPSGREWKGAEIKRVSGKIGAYLTQELQVKPADSCVCFFPNSDHLHLACLGALFAGASICAGDLDDPQREQEYMIQVMQPRLVLAGAKIRGRLLEIRQRLQLSFNIVIMDDDVVVELGNENGNENGNGIPTQPELKIVGLHKDILTSGLAMDTPAQVEPDAPAYVLLTSGSTGHPKPVARSHRNSVYVCHSLPDNCADLWQLTEASVLAGHLPLDHGTGTFSLKMTLAKGFRLILMPGYEQQMLLEAVERHSISDCILGSALVHNLMVDLLAGGSEQLDANKRKLGSLVNMISVGSQIPSFEVASEFMGQFENCKVRQSLGMTEVGFVCFVKRQECHLKPAFQSVGWLLPNLRIKLLELENNQTSEKLPRKEITDSNQPGELYIGGPTVSPGYLGAKYQDQQKLAFMPDGFYRTFDVALISPGGELQLKGRCADILCLGDGWKVLPAEIERTLAEHPGIHEAAVIGIPSSELPGCHAPRAYVVPKAAWRGKLTELEVSNFATLNLSQPKRLAGGVKIMDHLPRITLGKVDKRSLRQADGY